MTEMMFVEAPAAPSIPQSREAEEAVLGSIMIDEDSYYPISEIVTAQSFFIHRNKWIYETFTRLRESRTPIDLLTVSQDLEQRGMLSEVGGSAYLTSLIVQVPTSTNAEHYAKIVKGHADNRRLIELANSVAALAYSGKDYETKIKELEPEFESIKNNVIVDDDFQSLKDIFSEVYDEAERRSHDPKEVWGIPTGLERLDRETGGQQGGELTFWVGEPGVGKTWLLTGMAIEMSKTAPGGFLSMELRKQNIARRILSGASGVKTKSIRTGNLNGDDWSKINRAVEENEDLPLYLMYNSVTSDQLFHIVRQAKKKYNIGFLVVDYAMLFIDNAKDETERTAVVSRNLKRIAVKFDIAVNCIHSVLKTGMDGQMDPAKSNMRGSGQQIHDADNIYFITQYKQTDPKDGFLREDDTKKMVTLWCKKGRELENSDFNLHLVRKGNSPFFAEYDRKAAQMERGI